MSDKRGAFFLTFITLTILVAAFLHGWDSGPSGTVSLLVRMEDGTRVVETLDIGSGSVSTRSDVDASLITTMSARMFMLSDGSMVTIDTPGIVRKGSGTMAVLVASPVAPLLRTPLSVALDGAYLAWVNPADSSVQVFARSPRGSYLPAYVNRDILPNSLGFTEDGTALVVGKLGTEDTTFYTIDLTSGSVTHLTTVTGLASVVPTP